ncbi:IPTL-CTERM sorting domain-containing protein [Ottowia sp. VDI28]|uniref:IPTL-CTERM sorting domain-containing protein n=1 Tax=Ottowia sp. VDI28 TaxID=3133968 RepID=UPI003C2B75D2
MKKTLTSGRLLIAGLLLSGTMLMAAPAQAQAAPPANVATNLDALPDGAGNLVVSWTLPVGQETTASGVLLAALPLSDPPVLLGASCGAGATSCVVPGYQVGTAYGVAVILTDSEGFPVQSEEYLQVATLALPGGSQEATVRWHGPLTGQTAEAPVCVLSGSPGFTTRSAEDLQSQGAPAGATAPLGVLQFQATGCGPEETTRVVIDYPAGTLAGLKAYKYGPPEAGAASGWFAHGAISGDRVTYTVVNDGVGDSDSDPAAINDPFAPLDVPPDTSGPGAGGVQAVPTLGQWSILMLSALAGLLGWRVRRRL